MGDTLKYKKKHKENGLCVDCSRPAIPGQIRCLIHSRNNNFRCAVWYKNNSEKKNKYTREKRVQYVKENRCISCGIPLLEDEIGIKSHCVNCRDRSFKSIPKRKPIGGELLENYYTQIAEQS